MPKIPLVLFAGPIGESTVESIVDEACAASAVDMFADARESGMFSPLILVSDQVNLRNNMEDDIVLERGGDDFHFGRCLQRIIQTHNLGSVVAAGAGSSPLLRSNGLSEFAEVFNNCSDGTVVANNLFSADMVGFKPTSVLDSVPELPLRDNNLAQVLMHEGGLAGVELPRTVMTQFDIDTPIDLSILSLHPQIGPSLREYLGDVSVKTEGLKKIGDVLTNPNGVLTVAGRVGSHTWSYLEKQTACRIRMFSEERGMESDGRAQSGEVRSLLGYYLEQVGFAKFFNSMAQLGDAAVIDIRVLLAHMEVNPSREDRFWADLGEVEQIKDEFLRDFVTEVRNASIPIVIGGHSLVSGGLMALVEATWLRLDEGHVSLT